MSSAIRSEADILSRVIAPDERDFLPTMAKLILRFNFPKDDIDRMDELARKASEGSLSDEEQAEIDAYERVGHFLSLLQSKARASLNQEPLTPE